jgi:hypothetical protein
MRGELKLKLEESATPPPLPTLMPPPLPRNAATSDIRIHTEESDLAESLPKGILGGVIAAMIAAVLWAGITALIKWRLGLMAVGVGAIVGFGVRKFGHSHSNKFGYAGALLSLGGCLAGSFLAQCVSSARDMDIGLGAALLVIAREPSLVLEIMYKGFGPLDFLFYAIAIYAGYRFSFSNLANEY